MLQLLNLLLLSHNFSLGLRSQDLLLLGSLDLFKYYFRLLAELFL